jgi:hypothetical protein
VLETLPNTSEEAGEDEEDDEEGGAPGARIATATSAKRARFSFTVPS